MCRTLNPRHNRHNVKEIEIHAAEEPTDCGDNPTHVNDMRPWHKAGSAEKSRAVGTSSAPTLPTGPCMEADRQSLFSVGSC